MRSDHRTWTLALDDETVLVGDDQGLPDAPAIVLLHGLASNLRWWDPVAARLALRHRLVRFDHRGHGRSTGPAAGYTVQRLAADSVAVLDHLHLERVVLAGHSAGADIALAVAAAHPDRVAAVGCVDGGVYQPRLLLGDTWPAARRRLVQTSPASTSRAVLAAWLRGSTTLPREALDAVAANYVDDGHDGLRRRLRGRAPRGTGAQPVAARPDQRDSGLPGTGSACGRTRSCGHPIPAAGGVGPPGPGVRR
jgi:pimeloyl-ACP methyl ester carboxylesterase